MVSMLVPVLPNKYENVKAASGITTEMIDSVCKRYNYYDGYYWTYGDYDGTTYSTSSPRRNKGYVATKSKGYPMGETGNYNGYVYNGYEECYGFALFLMSQVTNTSVNPANGNVNGWKKYSSGSISNLKVGDIIRASNHSAVVYKVNSNGSYDFIEVWGGVNNNIKKGAFHPGSGSYTTLGQLKNLGLDYVYRYEGPLKPTIKYRTHIQNVGWEEDFKKDGEMSGTSGRSLRLEGINILVEGNSNLGVQYTTHCQDYGWLAWSANGEMSGTQGESKRLEAIMINLTGADKDKYDIYYRVHAQNFGWMNWAKNGAPAGTAGYAYRLEAIQIQIVTKGSNIEVEKGGIKSTSVEAYRDKNKGAKPLVGNSDIPNVTYRTHVQNVGWQSWVKNGDLSGTSGRSLRLEGINIKISNKDYTGGIRYKTHIQNLGWEKDWKKDGEMSGTSGRSLRLEAIDIELYGELAKHYDVYYRVHVQDVGWMGWAKNGAHSGTAGYGRRLEGIQIVLAKKTGSSPVPNYGIAPYMDKNASNNPSTPATPATPVSPQTPTIPDKPTSRKLGTGFYYVSVTKGSMDVYAFGGSVISYRSKDNEDLYYQTKYTTNKRICTCWSNDGFYLTVYSGSVEIVEHESSNSSTGDLKYSIENRTHDCFYAQTATAGETIHISNAGKKSKNISFKATSLNAKRVHTVSYMGYTDKAEYDDVDETATGWVPCSIHEIITVSVRSGEVSYFVPYEDKETISITK